MVNINLLPWREKQARYEMRVLMYTVPGAAACALLLLLCGDRHLSGQQKVLAERIVNLKKELIWREGLAKNHSQRNATVAVQEDAFQFFERLNEVDTQKVCFEQIKKGKSGIELMGFASTSEQLTAFLRTSSLSSYFGEVKINQLQQVDGQLRFNLLGKSHVV
jgi:Tfp pilus assembly protein PilN